MSATPISITADTAEMEQACNEAEQRIITIGLRGERRKLLDLFARMPEGERKASVALALDALQDAIAEPVV